MKKLGKIHLRTIEEGLSESEMKFVVGGSGYGYGGYGGGGAADCNTYPSCGTQCEGKKIGEWCDGGRGTCKCWPDPLRHGYCKICFH